MHTAEELPQGGFKLYTGVTYVCIGRTVGRTNCSMYWQGDKLNNRQNVSTLHCYGLIIRPPIGFRTMNY